MLGLSTALCRTHGDRTHVFVLMLADTQALQGGGECLLHTSGTELALDGRKEGLLQVL